LLDIYQGYYRTSYEIKGGFLFLLRLVRALIPQEQLSMKLGSHS